MNDISLDDLKLLAENLQARKWRISHLYHIVNKKGETVPFKLNLPQLLALDQMSHPPILTVI